MSAFCRLAHAADGEVPGLNLGARGGVVDLRADRGRVDRGAVDRAAAVGDEQAAGGDGAGRNRALARAREQALGIDALTLAHAEAVRADARGRQIDGSGAGSGEQEAGRVAGLPRVHDVVQLDGGAARVEGVAPGGLRLAVADVVHARVVDVRVHDQGGRTIRRAREGADRLASGAIHAAAAVTGERRLNEAAGGNQRAGIQRGVRDAVAIGVVPLIDVGDRTDRAVALRVEGARGRTGAIGVEAEGAVAVPVGADRGRLRRSGRSHGQSGEHGGAGEKHLLHGGYSLFVNLKPEHSAPVPHK